MPSQALFTGSHGALLVVGPQHLSGGPAFLCQPGSQRRQGPASHQGQSHSLPWSSALLSAARLLRAGLGWAGGGQVFLMGRFQLSPASPLCDSWKVSVKF